MLDDIVFAGGLGSQILSYMTLEVRRAAGESPRVNVDYFFQSKARSRQDENLSYWNWELDRYGISLPPHNSSWSGRLRSRFLPRHGELHPKNVSALSRVKQFDFRSQFPISDLSPILASSLGLALSSNYCAIHIRRGDYLTASSRCVEVDEVVALLERVPLQSLQSVLVFSDTPLGADDKALLRQTLSNDPQYCVGQNQHAVHGILRSASLLITSNSTFSVSAGLMMENSRAVVISPQHFFPGLQSVNSVFQSFGTWMIY